MTDPHHRDMKKHKEYSHMIGYVADTQYGILTECVCGARIIDEVRQGEGFDLLPGKRFFTCSKFKDDGLHFRHPWVVGVQEEIQRLSSRVEETEKLTWQVKDLSRQIETLKWEMALVMSRVVVLERLCFEAADSGDSVD